MTHFFFKYYCLSGVHYFEDCFCIRSLILSSHLTIGSYVSVRSSRYEALGKLGEHERCIIVAWGVAKSNSSFLSALQTSQVLHILMNTQLTYEPIVLKHFKPDGKFFFSRDLFADITSVHEACLRN